MRLDSVYRELVQPFILAISDRGKEIGSRVAVRGLVFWNCFGHIAGRSSTTATHSLHSLW